MNRLGALALTLLFAGAQFAGAQPARAQPAGAQPAGAQGAAGARIDYTNPRNWLCRPGRSDACAQPLTSTVIQVDGSIVSRTYTADPNAPVDCFYVYPTVSHEPTANADMADGPEEQHAALEQFARFGAHCRLYAPLYRQVTLAGLRGATSPIDVAGPYRDVLDAWNTYLARDNHGRGVVLIGHSQGSKILAQLLADEFDGTPLQARLISAIIPGTDVEVPAGRDAGGTFQHIPLCRRATQFGCVIAYSTYLASLPPGSDAYFGAGTKPGDVDACVDAAALDGSVGLDAELPAIGATGRAFGTTFIEVPGQLTASCATNAGHSYLAIRVSSDARVMNAGLTAVQNRHPESGLHALDVNFVLGNLVDLVGTESQAWLAAHPSARAHGAQ